MDQSDSNWGPLADVFREVGDGTATLVFRRHLGHSAEKVWRALTEPAEQLEWLPYVANRELTSVGPALLTMTDGGEAPVTLDGEVLECLPPTLLKHQWGEDLLTWELVPLDGHTLLTLRHETKMTEQIASFAAGWHMCIAIAERFMNGTSGGRIVGQEALDHGWADLHERYLKLLGASD